MCFLRREICHFVQCNLSSDPIVDTTGVTRLTFPCLNISMHIIANNNIIIIVVSELFCIASVSSNGTITVT